MISLYKFYIWLSKITHLALHGLPSLINLKNTKKVSTIYMKNYDFEGKQFQISDPIESYFECITTCDIGDGRCISKCVEILKHNDN